MIFNLDPVQKRAHLDFTYSTFLAYCSCNTITLGFCGLRRGHRTSQPTTTTLKAKPPVDSADCAPDCIPKSVYAQGQTSRTGNCFTEMSINLDKRSPLRTLP
ncbi:hypothetical protein B5807_04317 [Epicoccum nigrum]|uniref:Uncharacterized protein n=1 Tax=Epicoccum nigrum TaxID=105696 RepID=A0A1Y2M4A9_EPING|nr:hypothetical protein B5807_04317 [Epicoccum nigrum]